MKCIKCEQENADDAKFCNKCGEKLYEDKEIEIRIDNTPIKEEKSKNKIPKLSKRKEMIIGLIIPFVFIIVIVAVIYTNANAPKPEEVFKQFDTGKNLAMQQYNELSNENKQKVQTLIKEKLNSIYKAGDNKKLEYQILAYNDIPELKGYIKEIEDNSKHKKIYDEAQKEIDKANGINNMKDYEWMGLLDDYCSIPNTFENYDAVLDKIILLRDKYYNRFYDIPKSMKERNIKIGMTKKEVLASSWGRPKNINKTTNSNGTSEQWVYYNNNYLYFEGDKLTTMQN